MGLLIDGRWHDQWYDTSASGGRFVRPDSVFRNWVTTDGTPGPTGVGGYRAEAGRYHLYVSLACPWAHRTLIFRALKGLTPHIDVSVVHWLMAEQGWSFAAGDGVVPDPIGGAHYLHEVYTRSNPTYSGHVTVPVLCRAVPGMIHYAAAHARQIRREPDTFWLSRLRKGPGMQYVNSIFGELLKPIDRRQFREIVERHDGNAYDKTFKSWDHLVTMVGAQLGRVTSLRGVEATVKANSHQHYHLGVSKAPRATLSRANARRPVGVFAETFAMLAKKADRHARVEGTEMVRLIDSSPIPLGKMCEWAEWNGHIRGMKMHVVYHPGNDVPRCVEITPATVNDVEIGRQTELEAGATYVFDKGYYHFGWWKKINDAKAFFVTRVKVSTRLRATKSRYVRKTIGDGFKIISDADVVLASKGDSSLPFPLRRIKVRRDKGGVITLVTNDLQRTAVEIAALYKSRWQIELLFRWIKQHLNLRKFMGKNDNAIRLQIIAAMIAYLLLRLARRLNSIRMLQLRFAELVCQRLFMRKSIAEIHTPPPVNPSKPKPNFSPDQLGFTYA